MNNTHPTMQRLFAATKMQPGELAIALNTSPQNVTNWSSRGISKQGAMLASEKLNINMAYILFGTGDPFPEAPYHGEESALAQIPAQSAVGIIGQHREDTHIEIPRYDVRLSAGEGTAVWIVRERDNDPILFRKGWYKARRLNPEHLRGMYVRGDSMEPYLYDYDTVLIDITDTQIADGEVYAIVFQNRFYVKELRGMEGGVRIISRNEKYAPMEALDDNWRDERDFQVLGRVVWRGG